MKKIKLTRYPLTALAVVVIWTLCLIPIPETPLNQISLIDKWTHLVLFGGLTVIIWAEMLRDDKRRTKEAVYSDPKALSPSCKILSRRYALWPGPMADGRLDRIRSSHVHPRREKWRSHRLYGRWSRRSVRHGYRYSSGTICFHFE